MSRAWHHETIFSCVNEDLPDNLAVMICSDCPILSANFACDPKISTILPRNLLYRKLILLLLSYKMLSCKYTLARLNFCVNMKL